MTQNSHQKRTKPQYTIVSKKDQAMTQDSPKKGPGHVLTLFEYNIPSKKDQAETHNSFKKGPGYYLNFSQKLISAMRTECTDCG